METKVKTDTTDPEFNECIQLPMTIPSMTQFIKLELLSRQPDMTKILLATENLEIQELDQNKMWGQFFWVKF